MTPAARIGSASLFALVSILSVGPAAAAETRTDPDPKLCAEYLRDLNAYRRMAVLLGCQMPQGSDEVAARGSDETQFPPVIADAAVAAPDEFSPAAAEPVTSETEQGFPLVVEASTEPAESEFPPVVSESSSTPDQAPSGRSGRGSRGASSAFPPVETSSVEEPDETAEDPTDPVRAAIEEKLSTFKEEAKAHIRDAIAAKAEEVKERVKEKIKSKIEHAISHHQHNDGAPTLRRAAKNTVKRMLSGDHHHGGGLKGKLTQLLRR